MNSEEVKQDFENFLSKPRDIVHFMAISERKDGVIEDEQILQGHKGSNVFFDELGYKLAESFGVERSMIEEPETYEDAIVPQIPIKAFTKNALRTGEIGKKKVLEASLTEQKTKSDLSKDGSEVNLED